MNQPYIPSSRVQTERMIAAARVAFAASGLFAVWMDPAEPAHNTALTYGLHTIYVLYSLALIPFVWSRRREHLPMATHVVDILLSSVFQYLTQGPSSPFFVYFIFALFSSTLRWGWRGTLRTAAVVLLAYVGMAASMNLTFFAFEFELNRFIIRVVYLAVTAAFLAYLGRHEERLRHEIRRLAHWPSARGLDLEPALNEILAHAAQIVGASRAVIVWEQDEEPAVYLAVWSAQGATVATFAPPRMTPVVVPRLAQTTFVSEGDGGASADWLVRDADGLHTLPREPHDLHTDLREHLDSHGGLASSFFKTERVSGRVFFSNLGTPALEIVPLTEVVTREVGASLDQLQVTRHLQQIAAAEERIRLARDLHDGVLQSLTGIRLDIRSVGGLEGVAEPVRDRLFALERAIATEQRELRLFIAELEPHATGRNETPLAARLEALLARIARQWNAPVTMRFSPGPVVIPEHVEQAVPRMVQEAVVNALRHGQPSRVAVTVDATARELSVIVADDGHGFPFRGRCEYDALLNGQIGPRTLLGRVVELGGQMAIESSEAGARVEIRLAL